MNGTCEKVIGFHYAKGKETDKTCDGQARLTVQTEEGEKHFCNLHASLA